MNKKICLLTFYFTLIFFSPAHAYLDPGTFSIVLQSVLAAVAGIAATYKLWIYKLKDLLNKIKSKYKTKKNNPKE